MLALLGPCRADGVGGGQGYEDLRGLDGVDADALHETHTSRSLVSALGALRDAVAEASRASRDPAWADVGLCAPPVRFALCSWWPDLVLPTVAATVAAPGATAAPAAPPRSDAPDRAWLDPERADEALARLARSAARLPTADAAPSDPAEWATMTNPAGAAARASSLWREPAAAAAAAVADVAWITAAVDGGGGGDGEWPPEAVAAYGVMRAAVDAGARAVVVVLQEDEDGDEKSSLYGVEKDEEKDAIYRVAPLLADVARRAGADVRVFRGGKNPRAGSGASAPVATKARGGLLRGRLSRTSKASRIFFDPGARWRGSLRIPRGALPAGNPPVGGGSGGPHPSGGASGPELTSELSFPALTLTRAAPEETDRIVQDSDAFVSSVAADYYARASSATYASTRRRGDGFGFVLGDAAFLETVRTESVPSDLLMRGGRESLRLELLGRPRAGPRVLEGASGAGGSSAGASASAASYATRDGFFAAMTAATLAAAPGAAPAFLVRVRLARISVVSANRAGALVANKGVGVGGSSLGRSPFAALAEPPAPPHGDGPVLLVRADGRGGFRADALASVPALLERALAVAVAHAPEETRDETRDKRQESEEEGGAEGCRGVPRAIEGRSLDAGERAATPTRPAGVATPPSVATTGRKRKRTRGGRGAASGSGPEEEEGEYVSPEAKRRQDPEAIETALKSLATATVHARVADAFAASRGSDFFARDEDDDRPPRASSCAAFVRRVEASVGRTPRVVDPSDDAPPFARVLDALARRRDARDAERASRALEARDRRRARELRAAALALPAPPATSGALGFDRSGSDAFDDFPAPPPGGATKLLDEAALAAAAAAARPPGRGGGGVATALGGPSGVVEPAPGTPFLTAALIRASADVAEGLDATGAAIEDARRGSPSPASDGKKRRNRTGALGGGGGGGGESDRPNPPGSRAAAPTPSPGDARASPSRQIPVDAPADWAAAEAELQERVERDRRERRERQRMTMAPRHVPARRRTGNTILAAATGMRREAERMRRGGGSSGGGGGRGGGDGEDKGGRDALGAAAGARGAGAGTAAAREESRGGGVRGGTGTARACAAAGTNASAGGTFGAAATTQVTAWGADGGGSGSPPGSRAEAPSESAVGANALGGGAGARRNRVCGSCHTELVAIPGADMSLMRHCYACGGALG